MVNLKGNPSNNRILILHARDGRNDPQNPYPIGSGHFKAALAVAQALRDQGEKNILVEDALFFMTPVYSSFYSWIYSYFSSKKPHLFKSIYGLSDETASSFRNLMFRFWLYLERGMGYRLERFLKKVSPTVIICTHFLPLNIMSQLKKKGKLNIPVVGVVTDIHPHRVWIYPEIDLYCVADPDSLKELEKRGIVLPGKIQTTGIPVHPEFQVRKPKKELRKRFGVPDQPVTLILSTWTNSDSTLKILRSFQKTTLKVTLMIVTGRNQALFEACQKMAGELSIPVSVFQFVDFVSDLMELADIIVTKPGGLAISEALSKNRPMVLFSPIPGQEEKNADYLLNHGTAIRVNDPLEVQSVVQHLISDPDKWLEMQKQAKIIAKPDAAQTIARMALALEER